MHHAGPLPSTSNIIRFSSAFSRGCARKNGMPIAAWSPGESHSSERKQTGLSLSPLAASSR